MEWIKDGVKWVQDNITWIFSGAGVAIIGGIVAIVKRVQTRNSLKVTVKLSSPTVSLRGDWLHLTRPGSLVITIPLDIRHSRGDSPALVSVPASGISVIYSGRLFETPPKEVIVKKRPSPLLHYLAKAETIKPGEVWSDYYAEVAVSRNFTSPMDFLELMFKPGVSKFNVKITVDVESLGGKLQHQIVSVEGDCSSLLESALNHWEDGLMRPQATNDSTRRELVKAILALARQHYHTPPKN